MKTTEYKYMLVIETDTRKWNVFISKAKPIRDSKNLQQIIKELETTFKSYVVILNIIPLAIERGE
jgi:hypothetical protein